MTMQPQWVLPIREELRLVEPYGAPQLDLPIKLNTNENPYPPQPQVLQAMVEAARVAVKSINRYPDRELWQLRTKLACYLGHDLTPDQVWAANGSNEVMTQLLQAFGGPGRSVLTFVPSYSMYPEYARDTHTAYRTLDRGVDFGVDNAQALHMIETWQPDVVVIANPNNPTGTVIDLSVIEPWLNLVRGVVVVDEAYQEFSKSPSALSLLPRYPNLVVVRTMSKAFAFAGQRVGYLAASTDIINALRIVRLPYHLSTITQAVASAALDHADAMLAQIQHLRELRDQTIACLRGIGLQVPDSQANFFLCGPFSNRHAIWELLVDRGILVRETGPDQYLRVSVGTDQQMQSFYQALTEILSLERQV